MARGIEPGRDGDGMETMLGWRILFIRGGGASGESHGNRRRRRVVGVGTLSRRKRFRWTEPVQGERGRRKNSKEMSTFLLNISCTDAQENWMGKQNELNPRRPRRPPPRRLRSIEFLADGLPARRHTASTRRRDGGLRFNTSRRVICRDSDFRVLSSVFVESVATYRFSQLN